MPAKTIEAAQWNSVSVLAKEVADGTQTAVANVQRSLELIAEKDPEIKAVISIIQAPALARAAQIDADVTAGTPVGRLAGVPFIAKDNMLVFGADTTAASNMLKGFRAPYQATVIERLEAEGAICVAKANLDAFAHGGSTENSDFMITKNPHDTSRVAGGSSGGSAAAVAAGMVPFALGTDTGGSVRQPASYCGVIGYKPSYGLNSRSGVVAMASSTDTIGVLARRTEDVAMVNDVISGADPLDSTTIARDAQPYTEYSTELKGKRVGVIKEYFPDSLDPEVARLVKEQIAQLEDAGALISEVSLPSVPLALAVYYIVAPAEISSNLARHDGQRFQFSATGAETLEESYKRSRSEGFGDEAKRRIMIGTHVLRSGHYDAYYTKAQTVRTKLINEFDQAFSEYDFLVGPVAPTPAFMVGENSDPVDMYVQDVLTVGPSLVGVPAISIPAGAVDGLPVGLQLISQRSSDRQLFGYAAAVEGLVRS